MVEIVDEFFIREKKEKELGEYVKSLCKKYGVKYRFLSERKFDTPIVTEIKSRSIVIFLPDLIPVLNKLQTLSKVTEDRKKEIVDELIKHESTHIRVIDELVRRGISVEEQRKTEFALCEEFYVEKVAPIKEFDQMAYNELMIGASTKEGRYRMVKRIQKDPIYTAGVAIFLHEDEVKGLFKLEHPVVCEFLLRMKELYVNTNSVDDIIMNAKFLRFLVGFAK